MYASVFLTSTTVPTTFRYFRKQTKNPASPECPRIVIVSTHDRDDCVYRLVRATESYGASRSSRVMYRKTVVRAACMCVYHRHGGGVHRRAGRQREFGVALFRRTMRGNGRGDVRLRGRNLDDTTTPTGSIKQFADVFRLRLLYENSSRPSVVDFQKRFQIYVVYPLPLCIFTTARSFNVSRIVRAPCSLRACVRRVINKRTLSANGWPVAVARD